MARALFLRAETAENLMWYDEHMPASTAGFKGTVGGGHNKFHVIRFPKVGPNTYKLLRLLFTTPKEYVRVRRDQAVVLGPG